MKRCGWYAVRSPMADQVELLTIMFVFGDYHAEATWARSLGKRAHGPAAFALSVSNACPNF